MSKHVNSSAISRQTSNRVAKRKTGYRLDDAVTHLLEGVGLKPDYEEAKRNLSIVLEKGKGLIRM